MSFVSLWSMNWKSPRSMAEDGIGHTDKRDSRGKERQRSDGQHALCSIDERNGFFRFEHQGLDLRAPQCVGAGNARARRIDAFAFSDESQRKMRQWSQIAVSENRRSAGSAERGSPRGGAARSWLETERTSFMTSGTPAM